MIMALRASIRRTTPHIRGPTVTEHCGGRSDKQKVATTCTGLAVTTLFSLQQIALPRVPAFGVFGSQLRRSTQPQRGLPKHLVFEPDRPGILGSRTWTVKRRYAVDTYQLQEASRNAKWTHKSDLLGTKGARQCLPTTAARPKRFRRTAPTPLDTQGAVREATHCVAANKHSGDGDQTVLSRTWTLRMSSWLAPKSLRIPEGGALGAKVLCPHFRVPPRAVPLARRKSIS